MCPVIRISDKLYSRLESLAVGFDTPAALIERLLDQCEGVKSTSLQESPIKPELLFSPADETQFKQQLLSCKSAQVKLFKANGTCEQRVWNAQRLTADSNLRGNLWSGLLRGWKKKGIVKAELSITSS